MVMRKTKIVATIGPASRSEECLKNLIDSGLDVARQNFSHGDYEDHETKLKTIRKLSDDVGVMMDTQGPEIRLKEVEDSVSLEKGKKIELVTSDIVGDENRLPVDHSDIMNYLEEGNTVLIDDGQIELEVVSVNDDVAECSVVYGGKVSSRKSVNIPGKDVGLRAPTDKDIDDIRFGARKGFDFISASFVKSADELRTIKKLLREENSDMDVIAKIEHVKAVENLDEILKEADGVMIARGDLGVEIPASEVPLIQKKIIRKCNRKGIPVITATQMLKSMTESPKATRAEVSDVANAVMDGTDAVMLSEETAIGKYPVKSIEFMSEVVQEVEEYLKDEIHHTVQVESKNIADIISKNVWQASKEIESNYIVAHTTSGYTAKHIAKYRPETDIIVMTNSKNVQRKLNLVWGITAHHTEFKHHVDEMICDSAETLYQNNKVDLSDTLVLSAGVPTSVSGTTNMMEIRTVESLIQEKGNLMKGSKIQKN